MTKDQILEDPSVKINPKDLEHTQTQEPNNTPAEIIDAPSTEPLLPVLAEDANELVSIKIYPTGVDMKPSPVFQEILDKSRELTQKAYDLLDGENKLTPAQADNEDTLPAIKKEMDEIRQYDKQVAAALTGVRRVFNEARDIQVKYIEDALEQADFSKLKAYSERIKTFNEEVMNLRRTKNWGQVREYFTEAISAYPTLAVNLPNLTSFERLQQMLPKLATAAKTWKLTAKIKTQINTYIHDIVEAEQTILNLQSEFQTQLLNAYQATGDLADTITLNQKWIAEKEERERIEKEKIEKAAQELARQQEAARKQAEQMAQQQKAAEEAQKALEAKQAQTITPAAQQQPQQQKPTVQPPIPAQTVAQSAPFGAEIVTDFVWESIKCVYPEITQRFASPLTCQFTKLESLNLIHRLTSALFDANGNKQVLTYLKTIDDAYKTIDFIRNKTI